MSNINILVKHIDLLVDSSTLIRNFHDEKEISKAWISFNHLYFIGEENIKIFRSTLKKLFITNREIADNWTQKTFQERIVFLVQTLKYEARKCRPKEIEKIYNDLISVETRECELLYEIHGIKMKSEAISFGDFYIYNFLLSKDILLQKHPQLENSGFLPKNENCFLLAFKVKAKEQYKAVEIGNELCSMIEKSFNYMIGDMTMGRNIGIFNYNNWKNFNTIVCYDSGIGYHGRNEPAPSVDIEDLLFKDESQGHDIIWKLITPKSKTEIEKRIISSIEWIGKAIIDKDSSKSLVQFVFAIEGMLQYNSGSFITPSIVSQMSEWLAFIIHDDLIERKRIAKTFKNIYQKRSAVAHGSSNEILKGDLETAKILAKLMVQSFLTIEPYSKMKTMEELSNYITELKFK